MIFVYTPKRYKDYGENVTLMNALSEANKALDKPTFIINNQGRIIDNKLFNMSFANVSYDVKTIEFTITYIPLLNEITLNNLLE